MFGWAYALERFVVRFGTALARIVCLLAASVATPIHGRISCIERALEQACRNRKRVSSRKLEEGIPHGTRRQSIPQVGLLEALRGERQRRWASFGAGSAVETLVLIALI